MLFEYVSDDAERYIISIQTALILSVRIRLLLKQFAV